MPFGGRCKPDLYTGFTGACKCYYDWNLFESKYRDEKKSIGICVCGSCDTGYPCLAGRYWSIKLATGFLQINIMERFSLIGIEILYVFLEIFP